MGMGNSIVISIYQAASLSIGELYIQGYRTVISLHKADHVEKAPNPTLSEHAIVPATGKM